MKLFLILPLLLLGTNMIVCTPGHKVKKQLASSHSLSELNNFPLVHLVFLKTKEEVNQKELIGEIKKIDAIRRVKHLEVGSFSNLDDPRAMSDYNLIISMRFENETGYLHYQNHPIHLQLKEKLKTKLAGPPVTYDYWRK